MLEEERWWASNGVGYQWAIVFIEETFYSSTFDAVFRRCGHVSVIYLGDSSYSDEQAVM